MEAKSIKKSQRWEKLGRIIAPDAKVYWMSGYVGSAYAMQVDQSPLFDIYVTGRDSSNRSLIGRIRINIENLEISEISPDPVLQLGQLGAFDENGVSYPYLVRHDNTIYLYYTGWMPTKLTPFQNHVGLSVLENGSFKRVSRAPILERNNDDYLSIGSTCVVVEDELWRMWYTSFTSWGESADEHKHHYIIKYAESNDGLHWIRENKICINIQNDDEHSICRPTVLKLDNKYHMWYSYKGEDYRIGYAISEDGVDWVRKDEQVKLDLSNSGWDSQSHAYPHVFRYQNALYMLYCGNNYGKEGLGIARLTL